MHTKPSVLFVCLGNICRSPLAEAAFCKAAEEASLDVLVDSAGTAAYHVGKAPDPRSIREAAQHGIGISHYRGRQIAREDFDRFTHIFALDESNLSDILEIAPSGTSAHIGLLMDVIEGNSGIEVADPYYGGEAGFATTWEDVSQAAAALVRILQR